MCVSLYILYQVGELKVFTEFSNLLALEHFWIIIQAESQ